MTGRAVCWEWGDDGRVMKQPPHHHLAAAAAVNALDTPRSHILHIGSAAANGACGGNHYCRPPTLVLTSIEGLTPWNETKIYFYLSIEREGDHPLHKVRRRCSHSGCSYCFLHCDSFQRETVFFFFNQTTNKSVHCSAMHCTAQKVWSKWRCDDLLSLWNMSWLNPVNQTLPAFDLSVLNVNLKLLKWPTRWPHDNSRINVFISGNNVKISHKRVWHFTPLTATRACLAWTSQRTQKLNTGDLETFWHWK